jgi:hypothetical protein
MTTVNTLFSGGQGTAVPSGFVGTTVSTSISAIATGSMPSSGTPFTLGSISLTPGTWFYYGQLGWVSGATTTGTDPYIVVSINTSSATIGPTSSASTFAQNFTTNRTVNVYSFGTFTTTTTLYLIGQHGAQTIGGASIVGSTAPYGCQFFALKIA